MGAVMKNHAYPIAADEANLAGLSRSGHVAFYTGEHRPPVKGEWYLSGAIVEAYCAPNDLQQPFHIARVEALATFTVTSTERDYLLRCITLGRSDSEASALLRPTERDDLARKLAPGGDE